MPREDPRLTLSDEYRQALATQRGAEPRGGFEQLAPHPPGRSAAVPSGTLGVGINPDSYWIAADLSTPDSIVTLPPAPGSCGSCGDAGVQARSGAQRVPSSVPIGARPGTSHGGPAGCADFDFFYQIEGFLGDGGIDPCFGNNIWSVGCPPSGSDFADGFRSWTEQTVTVVPSGLLLGCGFNTHSCPSFKIRLGDSVEAGMHKDYLIGPANFQWFAICFPEQSNPEERLSMYLTDSTGEFVNERWEFRLQGWVWHMRARRTVANRWFSIRVFNPNGEGAIKFHVAGRLGVLGETPFGASNTFTSDTGS